MQYYCSKIPNIDVGTDLKYVMDGLSLTSKTLNFEVPLLGFAAGIELSQVLIVLVVLAISYLFLFVLRVKSTLFILVSSILIILVTIPMLIAAFPW